MSTISRSPSPNAGVLIPSAPTDNKIITLQVGDKHFTTRSNTLTQNSHFFASLLSGNLGDKQADVSYFIDSDPEIFNHILRYLRSGVFPIFYHKDTGHEYGTYVAMLEQAKFFGIEKLQERIGKKDYLRAVRVERFAQVLDSVGYMFGTTNADTKIEYHPQWKTEKVYVCPRGIDVHKGKPLACGRQCKYAQGDAKDEYVDEQKLNVVEVRSKVVFDEDLCFEERQ